MAKDLWGFNVFGTPGMDATNDIAVNPTTDGSDLKVRFNTTELTGANFATLKQMAEGGGSTTVLADGTATHVETTTAGAKKINVVYDDNTIKVNGSGQLYATAGAGGTQLYRHHIEFTDATAGTKILQFITKSNTQYTSYLQMCDDFNGFAIMTAGCMIGTHRCPITGVVNIAPNFSFYYVDGTENKTFAVGSAPTSITDTVYTL